MLSAIAIIPSAPVLVPELASGAASELADMREAVFAAAAALPSRWIAIGVGPQDEIVGVDEVGTFAGYGVDVPIALAPGPIAAPRHMPLCALITGWVRERASPLASAEVRVYDERHGADAAVDIGWRLREHLELAADPVGVLIVADGANTLIPSAPGGHDPASIPLQEALDEALAGGDCAALAALTAGIVGRVAFQVLAGLTWPGPRSVRELYRAAPYGVGYFVGSWVP